MATTITEPEVFFCNLDLLLDNSGIDAYYILKKKYEDAYLFIQVLTRRENAFYTCLFEFYRQNLILPIVHSSLVHGQKLSTICHASCLLIVILYSTSLCSTVFDFL